MKVVGQVDGDEHSGGRRVDAHVVCGVVQELGASVALNVVRVVVAPAELDVNPVFLGGGAVHYIPEEKRTVLSITPTHIYKYILQQSLYANVMASKC